MTAISGRRISEVADVGDSGSAIQPKGVMFFIQ